MSDYRWLWLWGMAGAVIFAGGALGLAIYGDPSGDSAADRRHRAMAVWNFALSVFTGAVFAQLFAEPLQQWCARIIAMKPQAAAMAIGLAANFLWPKLLRKLGDRVERMPVGKGGE